MHEPSPASTGLVAENPPPAVDGRFASVLPIGSQFPDGELVDPHGSPTSLTAALGGRSGVVIFYRGSWCPYCNLALRSYQQQLLDPLTESGTALVAISPQVADESLTMQEKNELAFLVLSDPGNQIASQLGIVTTVSEEARATQLRAGLDITATNADGTAQVPMPTVAIVGDDGRLVWIDVQPDHTRRTPPATILDAVRSYGSGTPSDDNPARQR